MHWYSILAMLFTTGSIVLTGIVIDKPQAERVGMVVFLTAFLHVAIVAGAWILFVEVP